MAQGAQTAMAGNESLTFAALLKRLRRLAGLTQEELAERAGYSPAYISALERGVRTPLVTTAELLADSLDLESEDRARLIATGSRETAQARRGNASVQAMPHPGAHPALVGRSRELAQIDRYLTEAGAPVLLVEGEPGIGKSRLLQEAVARARVIGYTVLQGGSQRHSARQAYAPVIDAVAAYLEQLSPAEQHRALEGCDWLVRLMPELADAVSVPSIALPPEQERRLAFRAIRRVLRNVAGPVGTLLSLDDLHWAGQDALDLLASLVHDASSPRLAVITAYRSTELRSDSPLSVLMADLASARLADHLALGPLTEGESLNLIRTLLAGQGGTEPPPDAQPLERLVHRAEGVAFFLISSAENLKNGVSADEVPWDMAQGIRQRVAALPPQARELLGITAVGGQTISSHALVAASDLTENEVLPALEAASEARLLEQAEGTGYRFVHDVVREVVESDLGAPRRMAFHRRIAEALENEGVAVEVLARHYMRGGQMDKATTFLERAGDEARSQHAYAAAIEFYHELLERLEQMSRTPAERARAQEKLGGVLLSAARYDEAIQVLEEAAGAYRAGGDSEGEVRAVAQLGRAHFRRGTATDGVRRLEPVLWAVSERRSGDIAPCTLMELTFALSHLYYAAGQFEESLAATERTAELARQSADVSMQTEAELARGIVLCALSSPVDGARILEAALAGADGAGTVQLREDGLQVLAGIYLIQGEMEKGRALLEEAVRLSEDRDDRATLVIHLALLARYCFVRGDWQAAHAHLGRAVDTARTVGPAWYTVLPSIQLGVLLQAEGAWDRASESFERIQAASAPGRVARGMPLALIIPAQMDILRGQPEPAVERLTPLVERAETDWAYGTLALTTAAWARLESGQDQVEGLVGRALALADKTLNRVDRVDALRVQAMLRHREDRKDEAEALFAAAVSLATDIPYPYAEGRALYAWGVALAAEGESAEAQRRLKEALAIFHRLGARKDIEMTTQALATHVGR